MSLWFQIMATALPAFLIGHAALAVSWSRPKEKYWKAIYLSAYGLCLACLVVGMMVGVWL